MEDWTPECQKIEEIEKQDCCDIHLYVITSAMIGVFSIAEVIDSCHIGGKFVILIIMLEGFDEAQLKSLDAVAQMVRRHKQIAFIDNDIKSLVSLLNKTFTVSKIITGIN